MTDLYHGDCLTGMRMLSDASIDLIYADPPFYTDRDFDSFDDRFDSMEHYINWLKVRLQECYRVLKPTGSIYCHLDWHAVHYVKVAMDEIFGLENFQNEIVWWYHDPSGQTKSRFMRKHDTILFYTKSKDHTFNVDDVRTPYTAGTINQGKKGHRSFGRVVKTHPKGRLPEDVWELPIINSQSKERMGYPTQKPESLLERIIKASSNPGDLILDPFCGCGTALAVAQKLGRRWIGMDMSDVAIELSRKRLFGKP